MDIRHIRCQMRDCRYHNSDSFLCNSCAKRVFRTVVTVLLIPAILITAFIF